MDVSCTAGFTQDRLSQGHTAFSLTCDEIPVAQCGLCLLGPTIPVPAVRLNADWEAEHPRATGTGRDRSGCGDSSRIQRPGGSLN